MLKYLLVAFCAPLFFATRGKWGAFFVNSFFYGTAILLLVTVVLSFLAPIPWLISVFHGALALRKEVVEQDATVLASKMVEAMRSQPPAPPVA